MNSIAERFEAVIRQNTTHGRRWAEMEALTGITATSWQKACNRKQRPTAEMIEAVAQLWPCFAFWMATGITDGRHGHVACLNNQAGTSFPEPLRAIRSAARPYFDLALATLKLGDGDVRPESLHILERARIAEETALSQAEDLHTAGHAPTNQ